MLIYVAAKCVHFPTYELRKNLTLIYVRDGVYGTEEIRALIYNLYKLLYISALEEISRFTVSVTRTRTDFLNTWSHDFKMRINQ